MSEDNVENRLIKIETSIASLSSDVDKMSRTMDKLTDLIIKQNEQSQIAERNRKDIDILFQQVRDINVNGTSLCSVHRQVDETIKESIEELYTKIAYRDKLVVSIVSSLIIAGIISAVSIITKLNHLLNGG